MDKSAPVLARASVPLSRNSATRSSAMRRKIERMDSQRSEKKVEERGRYHRSESEDTVASLAPSNSSLNGWKLARTALLVTRRLSTSAFLTLPETDTEEKEEEECVKILPLNSKMEPTYRMQPKDDEKFIGKTVEQTIERILKLGLDGRAYNAHEAPRLACTLSTLITKQMKGLKMPRYKIVCNVVIGQNTNQGVHVVSRCIWNSVTDSFTQCKYDTQDMFAVASIHGIYAE